MFSDPQRVAQGLQTLVMHHEKQPAVLWTVCKRQKEQRDPSQSTPDSVGKKMNPGKQRTGWSPLPRKRGQSYSYMASHTPHGFTSVSFIDLVECVL